MLAINPLLELVAVTGSFRYIGIQVTAGAHLEAPEANHRECYANRYEEETVAEREARRGAHYAQKADYRDHGADGRRERSHEKHAKAYRPEGQEP
jgi:hypothetical protein